MSERPDLPPLDLISQLCLEAGRIMEDASVEFALTLPKNKQQCAARLERLHRAGTDVLMLAEAAQALLRRNSAQPD